MTADEVFKRLMTVGGFPEPFLDGDEREARRWRRERFDRVLLEDIRDLESIRNISLLSLLIDQLRTRVGGLVVMSNIAGEIQVSPKTVAKWIELKQKNNLLLSFSMGYYKSKLNITAIRRIWSGPAASQQIYEIDCCQFAKWSRSEKPII